MLATPHLLPCGADRGPGDHLAPHRDDLLTEQDAEQADQRDHRRSGRPDVKQTVDDADQEAGAEGQQINLHGNPRLAAVYRWLVGEGITYWGNTVGGALCTIV